MQPQSPCTVRAKGIMDWRTWLLAFFYTGVALAARAALDPLLRDEMHFTFFWLAAVGAMWKSGSAACILTGVLGFFTAEYFFVPPRFTLASPSDLFATAFAYTLICAVMCYLVRRVRLTDKSLTNLVNTLEAKVQDRSEALARLEKTEQVLQEVLRALPVGVWVLDEQGRITITNPAGLQVWGGTRMVGPEEFGLYKARYLRSRELVKPHEWAAVRALSHGDTSLVEELEIEAFNGSRKIILNSAIPISDKGRIIGAIVINQDITETKRREEELRKAKEYQEQHSKALQEQVAEQTAHLHESIHSLEGMIYHIAHDLRSPLRAMQGFSTIVMNQYAGSLDAPARDYLCKIADAAVRMDSLIQDLLTYGRVAREEIGDSRIQIKLLIEECVDELRAEIASAKAIIRVDQPLPELRSNRSLLHKIFCNLISNAIRYARPGVPPEVRIYASHLADGWKICVQDNGIGIEPRYHQKIFRMFEGLARQDPHGSSGMGLAITKKAVQRLGGEIGVESQPGKGSCFWIVFPDQPFPNDHFSPGTAAARSSSEPDLASEPLVT